MTEQEWLTSSDPAAMLAWLTYTTGNGMGDGPPLGTTSNRKLRLFACACCRQVWDQLTDPRSRRAVEVAEKYADSATFTEELIFAERDARLAMHQAANPFEMELAWRCTLRIEALTENSGLPRWFSVSTKLAPVQSALLRDIFGNPWKPVKIGCSRGPKDCPVHNPDWLTPTVLTLARAAYEDRTQEKCGLCAARGFVEVEKLSRYESDDPLYIPTRREDCPVCHGTGRIETGHLDPARLAILADALEEAGCREESLLRHLRGQEQCPCLGKQCCELARDKDPRWRQAHTCVLCDGTGWIALRSPHVRGCWVVDLILGKK